MKLLLLASLVLISSCLRFEWKIHSQRPSSQLAALLATKTPHIYCHLVLRDFFYLKSHPNSVTSLFKENFASVALDGDNSNFLDDFSDTIEAVVEAENKQKEAQSGKKETPLEKNEQAKKEGEATEKEDPNKKKEEEKAVTVENQDSTQNPAENQNETKSQEPKNDETTPKTPEKQEDSGQTISEEKGQKETSSEEKVENAQSTETQLAGDENANKGEEEKKNVRLRSRLLEEKGFEMNLHCHYFDEKMKIKKVRMRNFCARNGYYLTYPKHFKAHMRYLQPEQMYLLFDMEASDKNKVELRGCEVYMEGARIFELFLSVASIIFLMF